MNRRAFLGSLVGGVVMAAAVRTWPFRVYSFPSVPSEISRFLRYCAVVYYLNPDQAKAFADPSSREQWRQLLKRA